MSKNEKLTIGTSEQLDLFNIIDPNRAGSDLSNTVELYDALPKYNWNKKSRISTSLDNSVLTKHCVVRNKKITIKIKPALVEYKTNNNNTVLIYPGVREELIEEALRKLAVHGNSKLVNKKAGVVFTLYELQKELIEMGHTYSIQELKDGINVCRSSVLDIITDDGKVISSTLFPLVCLVDRAQYLNEQDAKCIVQFHPLVNDSVINVTYRMYDYKKSMSITSNLGRFLYKKMSHYWVQASEKAPYTPALTTFLSSSSRGLSINMSENIRAMNNALDSLKALNIILDVKENRVKEGRKVTEIYYEIYPHHEFVAQAKKANIHKRITENKFLRQLKK